jgi:hypothetical protein
LGFFLSGTSLKVFANPFNVSLLAGHRDLIRVSGEEREIWFADGLDGWTYANVKCLWIHGNDGIVKLRNILDSQLSDYDITMVVERCQLPFKERIPPGSHLRSPQDQRLNVEHSLEFAGIITLRLNYPVTG